MFGRLRTSRLFLAIGSALGMIPASAPAAVIPGLPTAAKNTNGKARQFKASKAPRRIARTYGVRERERSLVIVNRLMERAKAKRLRKAIRNVMNGMSPSPHLAALMIPGTNAVPRSA